MSKYLDTKINLQYEKKKVNSRGEVKEELQRIVND